MPKYIKSGSVVNFNYNDMSKYAEQLADELEHFIAQLDLNNGILDDQDIGTLGVAADTLYDYAHLSRTV